MLFFSYFQILLSFILCILLFFNEYCCRGLLHFYLIFQFHNIVVEIWYKPNDHKEENKVKRIIQREQVEIDTHTHTIMKTEWCKNVVWIWLHKSSFSRENKKLRIMWTCRGGIFILINLHGNLEQEHRVIKYDYWLECLGMW